MVMVILFDREPTEASKFTGGSPAYFLQRHAAVSRREPVAGCSPFRCPCVCAAGRAWLFVLGVALLACCSLREWAGGQRRAALALARAGNLSPPNS